MITAVDTSVLLDVFGGDPVHGRGSAQALRDCIAAGRLIACEVVWAETSASFPTPDAAADALAQLGIAFSPVDAAASARCGAAWREYRRAGGSRDRVIADFLIAAHAIGQADRLLTRDRGFFRGRFAELDILDPSAAV